jgi:hypothetical protein
MSDWCVSDPTKKVPCSSPSCSSRRIHHGRPDEPRGTVWLDVPEGFEGHAYCSVECYLYGKTENDATKKLSE